MIQVFHYRPFHEVEALKIMITYVETACTFWAQVLTPDLLDATRQLETDLQECLKWVRFEE